jgi:ParB family chromosome partitioning protein
VPHPMNSVGQIPVEQIEANPYQPRTHFDQEALAELADSIKIQGIIQPVTVRQTGTNTYQLISGERRLQASKLAGLTAIPAYIRKADDQQMLEMALIENIQLPALAERVPAAPGRPRRARRQKPQHRY